MIYLKMMGLHACNIGLNRCLKIQLMALERALPRLAAIDVQIHPNPVGHRSHWMELICIHTCELPGSSM